MALKFGLLVTDVYNSRTVTVDPNCYGFILINKGADLVTVNGIKLKPYPPGQPELSGESFAFVDPERKVYNQDFVVVFNAVVTAPWLQIVQVYCA